MRRFPNYKQFDAMDCGPASLKIVSSFYGKNYSMKYLRDLCNKNKEGVSMLDISETAKRIGLRTLPLKATLKDLLEKIPLPCIVHWDYQHFVVVYKTTTKNVFISDPQTGLEKYSIDEFERHWKKSEERGYVLVLDPTADFYTCRDVKSNLKVSKYLNYLRPYKKFLLQVFFGMLIGVLVSLLFPLITQGIVDIGIDTKDYDFIHVLLVASIILTISMAFSNFIQQRLMLYVSDRVNISMVSNFIGKVMGLPISFFEKKMTSDILGRIQDLGRIQSFIFESFLSISIAILSFIVYSIILAKYSLPLFVIFIIGSILYISWVTIFLKKRRSLDHKLFDASVHNQNEIIQLVDGVHEIKVNNLQQKKSIDWEISRMNIHSLSVKMMNLSQSQNIGSLFIDRIKNLMITFFAAKSVINGDMTLGMMVSAQYIIGQMNGPIGNFLGYIHSIQNAKISLERVNEIVEEEDPEKEHVGMPMPIPEKASIKLENISFKYHINLPYILKNVSLNIPYGKVTAIVGASGSGKSTLLKLLLRFYNDYEGKIILGDYTDLNSIDLKNWRNNCGTIMQNGRIFNDTLLKNITLEDDPVDIDKLNNAIDNANLREFIEDLPLKLYTLMGFGGNNISGGQAQRILIARALYKKPKILLLDEATNSLDAKNEKEITQSLLKAFKGTTTVVVAHRLSTIQTADQIIVLDKGHVKEIGTHSELIEKEGFYFNLVDSQLQRATYEIGA